jgi:hypothetical protein
MTKVVNLKDFSKELGDFSKRSLKEQRQAVAGGIARSIPDLVAASPVDTGLYASSWDFTVDDEKAIIGNYAPYAGIIEYGARPFTPPIAPLLQWAHRVLNGSQSERGQPLTSSEAKATGKSQLSGYSQDEWRLAVGVQKKIQQYGMAPKHIMESMIPKIISNIKEELKNGK